ncbi:28S ribosomal protein S18c, mitochondrial [Halotydeus destructor]|nr:28S ribosomal protein S18c, mitochondrial [Halotydeus destructor]
MDSSSSDLPDFEMENPYKVEKQQCILCKYDIKLNYKNTRLISQFVSSFTGRIYDKHITGLCDKQQEALKYELQKAHRCGLLPKAHKDLRFVKDPTLFDPFKPTRPNPY